MLFTASRLNWPVQCSAARWVCDESVSRDERHLLSQIWSRMSTLYVHEGDARKLVWINHSQQCFKHYFKANKDTEIREWCDHRSAFGAALWCGQLDRGGLFQPPQLWQTFPTLALIVSRIRICVGGRTPWRSRHEQELLCSAAVWLKTSDPFDPCSSVSFNHLYLCHMRPGTEEPASTATLQSLCVGIWLTNKPGAMLLLEMTEKQRSTQTENHLQSPLPK